MRSPPDAPPPPGEPSGGPTPTTTNRGDRDSTTGLSASPGLWVSWLEDDGRAHHYRADSERRQWIVAQLAEATAVACAASTCEERLVPTRAGHLCCSPNCVKQAQRDRKNKRAERERKRAERSKKLRDASTYQESDSPDIAAKSRPGYQEVRADSEPVIADTADIDRRCHECGADISHRRAGAVVCGDRCRKALARRAAREAAGAEAAAELSDLLGHSEVRS
jgi:hypothetical protein